MKISLLRKKRVLVPAALLLLYTLVGFVVVPLVVRAQLASRLPALLHRDVTVTDAAFNPFALSLSLRGVDVREKDGGPFVSFEELFVDVGFLRLLTGRVAFDAIRIDKPALSVAMLASGDFSFADLLATDDAAPPAVPEKASKPLAISIDLFELSNGAFTFKDGRGAEPFEATLSPLTFTLSDFTTETGRDSNYAFDARFGDATFSYDGDISASPFRSKGKLSMQGVQLSAFQPYLAQHTQLALAGGVFGVQARYEIDGAVVPMRVVVEDARVDVAGLVLDAAGESAPLFSLGTLAVKLARLDATARTVALSEVVLTDGVVRALKEPDGQLQLVRLSKPANAPLVAAPAPSEEEPSPPWSVSLDRFALTNWALSWEDRSLAQPVSLKTDEVTLEVKQVRWPPQGPVDTQFALRWMDSGTIKLEGEITPEPLSGALKVALTDVTLAPLDGYLKEASLDGSLRSLLLSTNLDTTFADAGASYTAKGAVHLRDLALVDRTAAPVLNARAIDLLGLDVNSAPSLSVALDTVQMTGLVARVVNSAQGELNVSTLSRPSAPAAKSPKPAGPAMTARVGALVLDDLSVDWLDRTTSPPFATSLRKVRGRLTNVGMPFTRKVGMNLQGRLDQATLDLRGAMLPQGNASNGEVMLKLSGYDLPPVSPYSQRFTAQPVQKGKLSLELAWTLGNHKVNARNHLMVDQLAFGDRVPKPHAEAKSLPLGLAVAILSDRKGLIDMQLPMTGDMDAPDFAWGGLVWKTLGNVLEKVATAPFALLGGMFSGDDDGGLESLAFPAGVAVAESDEAKKLDTLALMLTERPLLRLELSPGAAPGADRDALAKVRLRAALEAARGPGSPPMDGAEYERLATAAWRKTRAPGEGTLETDPPFAQMEAELCDRHPIDDDALSALSALSRARGAWVADALEERGLDRTRIFVLPAALGAQAVGVGLK